MDAMEMPWWILPSSICLAWALWVVACATQVELENARHPLPDGGRRGFSPAPVIPVFPLVFWGLARLIDLFAAPWGSIVIASLHGMFAVVYGYSIVRCWMRYRSVGGDSVD
jgi:hypothetical protein